MKKMCICVLLLYLVVAQVVIAWNFQSSIHPFSLEQTLRKTSSPISKNERSRGYIIKCTGAYGKSSLYVAFQAISN